MLMKVFVERLSVLLREHSRIGGGIWFGGLGFLSTAMMNLTAIAGRGLGAITLYMILPVLAASLSGYCFGPKILQVSNERRAVHAVIYGMLVTIVAFLIFAPAFTVTYAITRSQGETDVLALTVSVLSIGLIAVSPVILVVGAIGGYLLYFVFNYARR